MTAAIVHLMRGDIEGLVGDAVALGFLPTKEEMGAEEYGAMLRDLQRVYDKAKLVSGKREEEAGAVGDAASSTDANTAAAASPTSRRTVFAASEMVALTGAKEREEVEAEGKVVYGAVQRRREKVRHFC